jgi:UDP-GlcNAc:undecaprenyl-phosphate GlcNAc-1-phosphate transferase
MSLFLIVALAACILSLILTPWVRQLALFCGLVDRPDNKRKFHKKPVPRVGGVAVAFAYFCMLGLLYLAGSAVDVSADALTFAIRLLPAMVVVSLTGLLDDLFQLAPWQKLIGQVIAGVLAYTSGIQITATPFGFSLEWWSLPLTVGWLVLCANAVNLIDGLDGLAGGIGCMVSAAAVVTAVIEHDAVIGLTAAPLVGAILGFLRYNRHPATVFLGDCGSLFIGFMLGCYAVLWSGHASTPLGMMAPLMALSIPLLDTFLAIVRRFLRKHPIFLPDRSHVHHRLLDRGLTVPGVAFTLYVCCGASLLLSLLMLSGRYQPLAGALFLVLAGAGIQQLGYAEFAVAVRMLVEDSFRKILRSRISLDQFAYSLAQAGNPEDCWAILKKRYRELGFCQVRMHLAGQTYVEFAEGAWNHQVWHVAIPISERDYVELGCTFSPESEPGLVAMVPGVIREGMQKKLRSFEECQSKVPHRGTAATGAAHLERVV